MTEIAMHNNIANKILVLREAEVILDRDIANMYQVENRVLKQAVKRNIERFPEEFMFELSADEINWLVSQSVIPSKSYLGGALPFAFTEQGVAMLSVVLKSPVAVHISIKIMKAFVLVRRLINARYEISKPMNKIEQHQNGEVDSTKHRRPLELIYFEACINQEDALKREKYFKTHYGKMFLKNRLKNWFKQ